MRDLKQEIIEAIEQISDDWILKVICRFIHGMTEGVESEHI